MMNMEIAQPHQSRSAARKMFKLAFQTVNLPRSWARAPNICALKVLPLVHRGTLGVSENEVRLLMELKIITAMHDHRKSEL